MTHVDDSSSVRVAVRIRPQLPREKIDNCRVCTSITPGEPQVVLGNDKAFTFDKVFDVDTQQELIFQEFAQDLIDGCLDGYNATILAYGQTGSGKTYSMGTGFDVNALEEHVGIIPRAVKHLFEGVRKRKQYSLDNSFPEPTFQVLAQFMELYNEDIYDLFDPVSLNVEGKKSKSYIKIHEDSNGSIYTQGVVSKQVNSYQETMECLRGGALSRTTASTNMNSQSSRSHAIFTLHVKQTRFALPPTEDEPKDVDTALEDFETLTAKFNFVDLAGSERLKRTGATGDRAKEGISINCGLLALGNVISALGDTTKKGCHVPYRDSKLTRLLQDSLGGNSQTVMIACISPSDRDFMETLNTLKYANRARNIKNRVVVNQDKTSKQLTELRAQIQSLQLELVEYKQGKRMVGPDGVESINDMFHENSLLQVENDKLRHRVKALQETVDSLTSRNISLANDRAAVILSGITGDNINEEVQKLVAGYNTEIESLRTKLLDSEAGKSSLQKTSARRTPVQMASPYMSHVYSAISTAASPNMSMDSTLSIIELAKQDVEKNQRMLMSRQSSYVSSAEDRDMHEEKADSGGGSGGDEDSGKQDYADIAAPDGSDAAVENGGEKDDLAEESGSTASTSESDSESEESYTVLPLSPQSPPFNESEQIQEDLAELSSEISLKQRMIEELEKSQRQLQGIRQHYEDKLRNLQDQINAVERERDQVLNSLGSKKQQSDEHIRKVKSEYESRLNMMQTELNRVNTAKKEHAKMMKNQAIYDKRIRELSSELNDMKKIKVRLMAQMKTDSDKNKLNDQRKNKELIQLKKEKRLRDNRLKMLELQNRQKDAILKRKHEEVSQLRKKQREASASSRVLAKNRGNISQHNKTPTAVINSPRNISSYRHTGKSSAQPVFSPKSAKSKWDKLEHYISSVIMRKQTIAAMEAEMDLHIDKRERLSKKIEAYSKRLDEATNREQIADLEDQLETMTTNMNYIQSNVADCQNSIIQMEEEAKDETVLSTLLNASCVEETKYLLEHLLSLTLSQGFDCTQRTAQYKELCARYEKTRMDSRVRDQLLSQFLPDSGLILPDLQKDDQGEYDGVDHGSRSSSSRSSPQLSGDLIDSCEDHLLVNSLSAKSRKARRRTATPAELLLGMHDTDSAASPSSPSTKTLLNGASKQSINIADIIPPAPKEPPPSRTGLASLPRVDTIHEEEETDSSTSHAASNQVEELRQMSRSDSYTVLNPTVKEKADFNEVTCYSENGELCSSSGSSSPDDELNLESGRLLAGSYTILNGEIRLDKLYPCNQGDNVSTQLSYEGKKIPPPIPPKPVRQISSTSIIPGTAAGGCSLGMNKWKGVVSSHLDDVVSSGSMGRPTTLATSNVKAFVNAAGDQRSETGGSGRDPMWRVVGRRKIGSEASPLTRRKAFQPSLQVNKDKLLPSSWDMRDVRLTPPSSPSLSRRKPLGMETEASNVFTRLTANPAASTTNKKSNSRGLIVTHEKISSSNQSSMVCVKKAAGHSKAILSICVTEDLLISGSKDLTCKVWDLTVGSELISLENHPNYVTTVRYCDVNRLVYSVSNSFVKIWDIRSGAKCIRVLSSSGLVHDSVPVESASSSQAILQQGEQQIFDIRLSSDGGQTLYTTSGSTVRVWDLRLYSAVGKIASGHQAPIICLDIHNAMDGKDNLITGSKDHLIKLFDLGSGQSSNCLVQPKFTLDPPHYDGVQCLAHRGNTLFSGSRDMCIKKWELGNPPFQQQSVNGAHKDWILGMCMLPDNDVLLSCCRSGHVKLWSSYTCTQLDEVKAHSSSVNCIAANSRNIFTASSDCTVKVWTIDSHKLSTAS